MLLPGDKGESYRDHGRRAERSLSTKAVAVVPGDLIFKSLDDGI
jgi:hypothetical protein